MNFVFDLYGTLIDIHTDESNAKFRAAVQKYFKRFNGGTVDFWAEYARLCALAETGEEVCEIDLFAVFKKLMGGADDKTVLKAATYFRKKSRLKLKVYGGVKGLLKELRSRGAGVYLVSNAQTCFTVEELKKLKLTRYFNGVVISSDFGKKKPSVEIFQYALQKFKLDPRETVYIGNEIAADVCGAKAAGMRTAYIKSNLSPADDSLAAAEKQADFATDNFYKLSRFLLAECGEWKKD